MASSVSDISHTLIPLWLTISSPADGFITAVSVSQVSG